MERCKNTLVSISNYRYDLTYIFGLYHIYMLYLVVFTLLVTKMEITR